MAFDEAKLNEFLGKAVGDLGAAVSATLVLVGDRLGLYKALAAESLTPQELADKTGTNERYVREWLGNQGPPVTSNSTRTPASGRCRWSRRCVWPIPTDRSTCPVPTTSSRRCSTRSATRSSTSRPVRACSGASTIRVCSLAPSGSSGRVTTQTCSDPGCPRSTVRWSGCKRGAKVADVGCGHGARTVLMAQAFPNSTFVGYDYHPDSIEVARPSAQRPPASTNATFEVADADRLPRQGPRSDRVLRLPARHG